jgi:hypothetical protein
VAADFPDFETFERFCWSKLDQIQKQLDVLEAHLERDHRVALRKHARALGLPSDATESDIQAAKYWGSLGDDPNQP